MKNAGAVIAVVSVFLAAIPGRSQDSGVPAGAAETKQSAPAAKCLTLQQRMAEWGKLRQVSQTTAMPVPESTSPEVNAEAAPPAPAGTAAPPLMPTAGACLAGPGHRPCWEQLDDWVTYRPLSQNCCDCFPKCVPCCYPPLYAFFLGNCCVQPVPPTSGNV